MIDLGLARIGRLLQATPQSWRAIHVAGTNGKGSICAYLSAALRSNGLSCGRFTSPHLIDRWDCINVNGRAVSETVFRDVEKAVRQRDQAESLGATEFELLAATAFGVFQREKVEVGVVEVGLGGKLDATNALRHKVVTVIAKIGLDHQSFLGNTLEEIALQKAGIMRPGVPCVVDGSNHPSVLRVIEAHAKDIGTDIHYPSTSELAEAVAGQDYEPHQIQNLACAFLALRLARPDHPVPLSQLFQAIKTVRWPGRLQMLDVRSLIGRLEPVLLDGAHNRQSAEVLAAYVQKHFRSEGRVVTWVFAASQGKDMDGIVSLLVRPGDKVAAVQFGPVDGMPWVRPADPQSILDIAGRYGVDRSQQKNGSNDLQATLNWASDAAGNGPLVVAGSLYLVSDLLRLLRNSDPSQVED